MYTNRDGSTFLVFDVHTHMGTSSAFKEWSTSERILGSEMIQHMDEAGVDIICSFPPGAPNTNYYETNQRILDAAKDYPGRIYPFARLNPLFKLNDNVDHLRKLVPQGLKGIKLHPMRDGAYAPNDPVLVYPLMEEIKTHNLVVLFHAGEYITSSPSLIAEVARDFPTIRFIIGHFGMWGFHHEAIAAAKRLDNIYIDTAGVERPQLIRIGYRAIGGHRILYGSDHPYGPFGFELDKVTKYAELEDEEMAEILGANTASLFGEDVGALRKEALSRKSNPKRRQGDEAKK